MTNLKQRPKFSEFQKNLTGKLPMFSYYVWVQRVGGTIAIEI
jgi:hypothetical protein